jgi:hypothetical protein
MANIGTIQCTQTLTCYTLYSIGVGSNALSKVAHALFVRSYELNSHGNQTSNHSIGVLILFDALASDHLIPNVEP